MKPDRDWYDNRIREILNGRTGEMAYRQAYARVEKELSEAGFSPRYTSYRTFYICRNRKRKKVVARR